MALFGKLFEKKTCDICGGESRIHAAAKGEHICNYCGGAVSECVDNNKDRLCDICKESFDSGADIGPVIVIAVIVVAIACIGIVALILIKKLKRK